jgi:hypothetical protein
MDGVVHELPSRILLYSSSLFVILASTCEIEESMASLDIVGKKKTVNSIAEYWVIFFYTLLF